MLVLSRYEGEDVLIGEGAETIVVRIITIQGRKVRVGVFAPPQIRVDRREVREKREQERADG